MNGITKIKEKHTIMLYISANYLEKNLEEIASLSKMLQKKNFETLLITTESLSSKIQKYDFGSSRKVIVSNKEEVLQSYNTYKPRVIIEAGNFDGTVQLTNRIRDEKLDNTLLYTYSKQKLDSKNIIKISSIVNNKSLGKSKKNLVLTQNKDFVEMINEDLTKHNVRRVNNYVISAAEIDKEDLLTRLKEAKFAGDEISEKDIELKIIPNGMKRTVFKTLIKDKQCIFITYDPNVPWDTKRYLPLDVKTRLHFQTFLSENGIPAPKTIVSVFNIYNNGKLLEAYVDEAMAGSPCTTLNQNQTIALGQVMGKQHRLGMEFLDQYNISSQSKKKYAVSLLPRAVIHGDMNLSNLMFRGDKLTGVIDFESVHIDAMAAGVVQTLLTAFSMKKKVNGDGKVETTYGVQQEKVKLFLNKYFQSRELPATDSEIKYIKEEWARRIGKWIIDKNGKPDPELDHLRLSEIRILKKDVLNQIKDMTIISHEFNDNLKTAKSLSM